MSISPHSSIQTSRGFTLLELMTAITVLGILLGLGVPAFNEIVRNNRVAAQANDLVLALNLTRSEATKRGMPVSICAASSAAQTACGDSDQDDWKFGWLVFSDRTGTAGVIDADDELLQTSRIVSEGLHLTSDTGFARFAADGSLVEPVSATFTLQHVKCTGNNRREISVSSTGRANLAKEACE